MNTRKPIEVCITIDTEFSIGGNFEDPALTPVAEPMVLGSVGGKEQGLGFLLESLAEFGVRATFFVERCKQLISATSRWGDRPHSRGIPTPQRHPAWRKFPFGFMVHRHSSAARAAMNELFPALTAFQY